MVEAEVLALEEINAGGRPAGRPAGRVGRSPTAGPTGRRSPARRERLIQDEKVSVIFGCWTSASRKSVKPVVEQHHHLLFYPDGLRGAGAVAEHRLHRRGPQPAGHPGGQVVVRPPQGTQVLPRRLGLRLAARASTRSSRITLEALGAEVVGEEYVLFGSTAVDDPGRRDQAGQARRGDQHGGGRHATWRSTASWPRPGIGPERDAR